MDSTRLASGGSWSVYWYNGVMVSSEISRGLDIFELKPSGFISQNEIDAAKSVHLDYLNTQGQPKLGLATELRARTGLLGLAASGPRASRRARLAAREALAGAEKAGGAAQRDALTQLAARLDGDMSGAGTGRRCGRWRAR